MSEDDHAAYRAYLERFDRLVGARAIGQYGTWNKHLVKKFEPAEFSRHHEEYLKLEQAVRYILETGATMNDAVTRALAEAAAQIVLDPESVPLSPVTD